ncbi:S8 family peptidase [Streptomyces sp. HB2AG]|uniref:S8 family peptidase n=1 Tax=Streptomyces sp. HB2AG TaxID=2983400 RepID=UPI0022AAE591|nr:S8 family serine peptidase [Streptomyces sp. HB2AG]MCZ2526953.1 S8 family serine peptidase [Streptomyces sp. HB2AG]
MLGQHADRRRGAGAAGALHVLVLLALLALLLGAAPGGTGARRWISYLVVASRADAAGAGAAVRAVREAGGRPGTVHRQIGTVLAWSSAPDFAARLRNAPGVRAAGATRTAPLAAVPPAVTAARPRSGRPAPAAAPRLSPAASALSAPQERGRADAAAPALPRDGREPGLPVAGEGGEGGRSGEDGESGEGGVRRPWAPAGADEPPPVPDPGERGTWNLAMVGAEDAAVPRRALQRVLVAVLDSGVDDTHPDLRAAVDPRHSASCVHGRADGSPGAWRPLSRPADGGHGTHVAATVAAARDGRGVAGVAPGARIAAVRLLGDAGQYYTENIVCGLLWAADNGARVINNSYFADPWKYNCPGDPDQAALIEAVGRAVAYARSRGAVVVTSAGNDGQDLDAVRVDGRSPHDHSDGVRPRARRLGPECVRLPGELPGVLGVTAVGPGGTRPAYSNHAAGRGWPAAPGGDPYGGPGDQVVSAWPGGRYAALSGTSMAAAHVSGVVAVIAARHPDASPDRLQELLNRSLGARGVARIPGPGD